MTSNPRLADLIAAASELMQERSGKVAVCSLTKAGQSVPGLKYAEGRWAALREVQRAGRADAELAEVVAELAHAWAAQLERLRSQQAGIDWIAYRSGGTDALAELAQTLPGESGV